MNNNLALLFPGQGSQIIGMGLDFYNNFHQAKDVFLAADDLLKRKLSSLIFNGTSDDLKLTSNSQIAIMVVSIAILEVLKSEVGLNVANAKYVIGHSLGEYTALVAANAINFQDAVKLLDVRARAMNECAIKNPGGMIAVLGLDISEVESICFGSISLANDNCPGQIVITGLLEDLDAFTNKLIEFGCKKFVKLDVSGPFHSVYMSEAAEEISNVLRDIKKSNPIIPIILNVLAKPETEISNICETLVKQVTSRIRFRESIDFMHVNNVNHTLEIGPGKVLSGLVKRCNRDINTFNVSKVSDIDILLKEKIC